jgi:hypothetical protein
MLSHRSHDLRSGLKVHDFKVTIPCSHKQRIASFINNDARREVRPGWRTRLFRQSAFPNHRFMSV